MACCKCCCGNKTCGEGEAGKCCCGGPTGSCCTASQYCCSGTCQSTPCGGACCDPVFGCGQVADEATCTDMGGTWLGYGIPCDPDPCLPVWCQLQGVDDDIQCVAEPDSDRAVIERRGELLNNGDNNYASCTQPGESCYGCYGYATFCWDGTVPEEWQDYVTSCSEMSATATFNIESWMTINFGCDFQIVEKKRADRGGLENYPGSVINIAFLGCCDQDDLPP